MKAFRYGSDRSLFRLFLVLGSQREMAAMMNPEGPELANMVTNVTQIVTNVTKMVTNVTKMVTNVTKMVTNVTKMFTKLTANLVSKYDANLSLS
ncbi:hypothetical protein TNCV_4237661 [Trichonephila clavipes]|nr:hypothetical protein TNCV_4237661 [Trichonephila clavipes]